MQILLYTAPENADFIGEKSCIPSPKVAELIALLRRGASYWGKDSGSGSLQWCDALKTDSGRTSYERLYDRPGLSIMFHEGLGFHIAFSPNEDEAYLVPFNSDTPDRRIKHYLGGNQAYFPANNLFPAKWRSR